MPVGKKLAAERRSQSKTLTEIVESTKVMGRMLTSLENERWDDLPAPSYVKGYIQSYAQALGLDPKPLIEEYEKDIAIAAPAPARSMLNRLPEQQVVPHRHELNLIPSRAIIIVVGAFVVVILALWGISALAGRNDPPPPLAPESSPVAPSDASTMSPSPGDTVTQAPEGAYKLVIKVAPGDSSWVRVAVDGLVAYEGTLPGGEEKSWTVADSATIRAGKPTAVTVTRDGDKVEFPRANEGIAELTISAAGQ